MRDGNLLVDRVRAAKMLSISVRLLADLTQRGAVPCVRIGRRVLYSVKALEAWIHRQASVVGVS